MRQQDKRAFMLFGAVTVFAAIVTSAYLAGHAIVHTEQIIPATPEKVWQVLIDKRTYGEWHTVIEHVEGRLEPGQHIVSRRTSPDGEQHWIESNVVRFKEERLLNLYGGTPLVRTYDHRFELEPVPQGTRLTQLEEYRGIGVLFDDTEPLRKAYVASNKALSAYVQALD